MIKIVLILLFPFFLFGGQVTIHAECNYRPYSYCEDGKVKGISIDIFKSIFSKIQDYSLNIVGMDLKEARKKMKAKEILMLGTMSYRKSRLSYVHYTAPYIYHNKALYCNKKYKKKIDWPKDFYGSKIARAKGHSMDKVLKKAVKDGFIEIIEGTPTENIQKLINGEVDCYIDDSIALKGEMLKTKKEYRDKNLPLDKVNKITEAYSLSKSPYHIGFSKVHFSARNYLIKKINLAIKVMQSSNEIDEIVKKNLDRYLHPDKKRKIVVAIYDWGYFVSNKFENYGLFPVFIAKAFENRDIEMEYKLVSSQYAYLLTKWGETCATFPWFKTENRSNYMYYSDAVQVSRTKLHYLKKRFPDSIRYEELIDLKRYKIGGVSGYFYEETFYENGFDYQSFKNLRDAIDALILGKIDLIPSDEDVFLYNLQEFFPDRIDKITFHKKNFSAKTLHIMFSKQCENIKELRDEFNIGLKNIRENGVLEKLLNKYGLDIKDFDEIVAFSNSQKNQEDNISNSQ